MRCEEARARMTALLDGELTERAATGVRDHAGGCPACGPALRELEVLLAWAGAQGVEVGVVGSGSNLLVADAGVRGLVIKLDQELSQITVDGVYCIVNPPKPPPAPPAPAPTPSPTVCPPLDPLCKPHD